MAISCPVDLDTKFLRSEVSDLYSKVVVSPGGEFHFHRGPAYAAEFLGYDAGELAALPPETTSAFAGVGMVRRAYEEAIRERYRFYSYGDAMLIL